MTVWAMLMVEFIYPLILELSEDGTFGNCPQCTRATSSVMSANVLLFKTVIAGDSWGEIAVPVIEKFPWTAIVFMGSLLTLVFGVLNLIVAAFWTLSSTVFAVFLLCTVLAETYQPVPPQHWHPSPPPIRDWTWLDIYNESRDAIASPLILALWLCIWIPRFGWRGGWRHMNEQWCKRNGIFRHLFMRWVLAHAPLTKRLNSVVTMQVPDSIKKDKKTRRNLSAWLACCMLQPCRRTLLIRQEGFQRWEKILYCSRGKMKEKVRWGPLECPSILQSLWLHRLGNSSATTKEGRSPSNWRNA